MSLGSIARRAVSAFAKSKSRGKLHGSRPVGATPHRHQSAEKQLVKGAVRTAKKKL